MSRPTNRLYLNRRAVALHPVEYLRYLTVLARARALADESARTNRQASRLFNDAVDRGRRFYA